MITSKNITEKQSVNSPDAVRQLQLEADPIRPNQLHRKTGENWLYYAEKQPQMTEKLALIHASIIGLFDNLLEDGSLPHVVETRKSGLDPNLNTVIDTINLARSTESGSVMAQKEHFELTTKDRVPVQGHDKSSASIIDGDVAVRIYRGSGDADGTSNLLQQASIAVFKLNPDADPNVFHGGEVNAITLDQIKNSKDVNFMTVDRYGWHDESYSTRSLKENTELSVDAIISALGKLKVEIPA